jgi:hypothetical protein
VCLEPMMPSDGVILLLAALNDITLRPLEYHEVTHGTALRKAQLRNQGWSSVY